MKYYHCYRFNGAYLGICRLSQIDAETLRSKGWTIQLVSGVGVCLSKR